MDWRVLLIGGNSGTGKTVVAHEIAHRFGASVLLVDDIRLALQRITIPEHQPALHYFLSDSAVWQRPSELLVEGWIGVAKVVSYAIEIVIAHHIAVAEAGPVVIEGDGILPSLAAQDQFAGLNHFQGLTVQQMVRSVFLFEPDEEVLLTNMQSRDRGFDELPSAEQRVQARASWLYGQWLRQEALAHELPAVPARPWETLTERVLAAIEAE
jgi:2-phosphoglycerate kinase